MKAILTSMFLMVLVMLCLLPSTSFAVPADTVIVSALPPGNLNNFINADTISSGFVKPNTVFLLKPTGALDTVYWMTAPVSVKGNITIVGYVNPTTGHPPVVAPSIAGDNSSIGNFFTPQGNDTLTVNGVYFMGTRTDSISVTGRFLSAAGPNNCFVFNHCIFENISGAGTPNLFDVWQQDHNSYYVTNCVFRNNQDDNPQNPGFAWVDPGTYPADTIKMYNNTFFVQPYILGSSGYGCKYLDFQHNTIFMSAGGGSFVVYQLHNAVIKNNIFFGAWATAYPLAWYAVGGWGAGLIALDSLSTLKAAPYNMTEADRHVTITNNAYFWPQQMVNKWAQLSAGTYQYMPLRQPDFISAQPGILTDKTTWPNITVAHNDSVDPGFNSTLLTLAAGKMAAYVDTCWAHGGTGQGVRPYVYPLYDPPTWDGVPTNWRTVKGNTYYGYPVVENLRYSNTSLQTAGSDGKALGDLNWFPEQISTSVSQTPNSVPGKFELSQNYPNPFNPSTKISYTLAAKGMTRLSVYDILGREVAVLVNEIQNVGSHDVTFTANNFSSGVYFYKLSNSGTTTTLKMVLMK
jgi:hypothetical protein